MCAMRRYLASKASALIHMIDVTWNIWKSYLLSVICTGDLPEIKKAVYQKMFTYKNLVDTEKVIPTWEEQKP